MTGRGLPLVLASSSDRRIEILRRLGVAFENVVPDVDETVVEDDIPAECMRISRSKVNAVRAAGSKYEDRWILAADTLIGAEGRVLGKPRDENEAVSMLTVLSGRTHTVVTGISLYVPHVSRSFEAFEQTRVSFARLTHDDMSWYVATREWEGAAGAYKIQGRGECLVDAIHGSYSNVVGLPIRLFYGMVVEHGFPGLGHRDLPIPRTEDRRIEK